MVKAPALPHGCGSWILVEREPRRAVLETFYQKNADKLARQLAAHDHAGRYELVPASVWLASLTIPNT